jgi:hypothetical protein
MFATTLPVGILMLPLPPLHVDCRSSRRRAYGHDGIWTRAMSRDRPNPMHELLRQELGIDAFPMDGQTVELAEAWSERPRRPDLRKKDVLVV